MDLLKKLRLLPGFAGAPKMRKTAEVSGTVEFLETSRLVGALIFFATVALIVLISFVGVDTVNLPVLEGQRSSVRIVAATTFTYPSEIKQRKSKEEAIKRLPQVYRLDMEPLRKFESHLHELRDQLEKFERDHPPHTFAAQRRAALVPIVDAFNARGGYHVSVDDVMTLLSAGDAKMRFSLFEAGLLALRETYEEGVYDEKKITDPGQSGAVSYFQITRADGETSQLPAKSTDKALSWLKINLTAEGVGREMNAALFRLFRHGIQENLVPDTQAIARMQQQALNDLKPVNVTVAQGQTIVEPETIVTGEQIEMLKEQRKYLQQSGLKGELPGLQFLGRILLVLAMVIASGIYIRLEDRETLQSNGRLALLALVVVVNLGLVRLTYWAAGQPYFIHDTEAASLLPYFAPTALAPLIVAILIDAGSAIFMALLISIFTSVIYGNRLDLLVLTFLASLIGIFSCQHIRKRGRVVRAAGLGGLTVALFALLIGVIDQLDRMTVLKQMAVGLSTGLATGVLVVGILPVLEGLFKRTTDITLLELTDYNHPLLRLMQMEAPGTYHHSLIVAQLAENAANAIGANPLLARVCALFHDIGKTKKPEYFTENQRERTNPHDENNPSLSALIIKSHVKDGVDLALKHNLPRAVIDVIQQHHGTTLIRYFFQRAMNDKRQGGNTTAPGFQRSSDTPDLFGTTPGLTPAKVCETTYRYDGPKPQFKESAIIHLADAVEAASRSMRKVTPQHLGELIDQIFRDRMEDGQLDEAPITIEELTKIKSSFTFTLLNMLHSRVGYAPAEPEAAPQPKVQPSGG